MNKQYTQVLLLAISLYTNAIFSIVTTNFLSTINASLYKNSLSNPTLISPKAVSIYMKRYFLEYKNRRGELSIYSNLFSFFSHAVCPSNEEKLQRVKKLLIEKKEDAEGLLSTYKDALFDVVNNTAPLSAIDSSSPFIYSVVGDNNCFFQVLAVYILMHAKDSFMFYENEHSKGEKKCYMNMILDSLQKQEGQNVSYLISFLEASIFEQQRKIELVKNNARLSSSEKNERKEELSVCITFLQKIIEEISLLNVSVLINKLSSLESNLTVKEAFEVLGNEKTYFILIHALRAFFYHHYSYDMFQDLGLCNEKELREQDLWYDSLLWNEAVSQSLVCSFFNKKMKIKSCFINIKSISHVPDISFSFMNLKNSKDTSDSCFTWIIVGGHAYGVLFPTQKILQEDFAPEKSKIQDEKYVMSREQKNIMQEDVTSVENVLSQDKNGLALKYFVLIKGYVFMGIRTSKKYFSFLYNALKKNIKR